MFFHSAKRFFNRRNGDSKKRMRRAAPSRLQPTAELRAGVQDRAVRERQRTELPRRISVARSSICAYGSRMQKRLWLGVLVVGLPTAFAFGLTGAGCGGSSDDSAASNTDSGADVSKADTSTQDVVVIADAGRCDDADLNNLTLPEVSLGDGGATTTTCVACMKEDCAGDITQCNKDCACKDGVDDALNCVAGAGGLSLTCLGGLQGNTNATNLGECIYVACQKECGLGQFIDGGIKDASDDGG